MADITMQGGCTCGCNEVPTKASWTECKACLGRGYLGVIRTKKGIEPEDKADKKKCPKCLGTGDRHAKAQLKAKLAAEKAKESAK